MASFFKQKRQVKQREKKKEDESQSKSKTPDYIESSLSANLEIVKKKTGKSPDIIIRTLKIGLNPEIKTTILYVQGLIDNPSVTDFIIESIMKNPHLSKNILPLEAMEIISEDVVSLGGVERVTDWEKLFLTLLSGDTIIFIDEVNVALVASTRGGEKRSIQEPSTHLTVRGSREGFTESNGTNIAMLRRIINTPDLWIESMKIGTVTKTDVSIMYINGIVKEGIVEEVKKRLNRINIDSILESGYIEQLIEDQVMTPFPTLNHTERPDMVAGNLLEGRVAIFVNGTPFVLIAPALFVQFFQSVEDYYNRFDIASATRFLRIIVFIISIVGPAVYVAATTFHQEMIPTKLLVIVAAQRETVPLPAVVEALLMEMTFEILREASLRMPKAVGSTMSIVGALVIGQAAVQAGIVSPAMVIIVSITAIASFATPSYAIAISARIVRFGFIICAGMLGFYGMILAFIILIVHLCSLRSLGVPYMTPLAPLNPKGLGDTFFRRPIWAFKERPQYLTNENNLIREGNNQRPLPPESRGMKTSDGKKGEGNES
ncbi:spore germination protein [Peribacillus frigoritolerans]|jgi:spore germination protein KA|uniref:spore germination protein n=1 Tax=Peribacillus TaxID=2675229 RepID=UPI0007BF357B|nr:MULTISPECIES: spore germination protein [Peribacillus]MDP9739562.1 spore germination protein KA [Bacillus sp. B2I3]PAW28690.1 spore germination protein [Peribacillus simplex]PHD71817.1 spore germination protein [Bacillus sp. AFS043905]MCZ0874699.1 spore germination protein [Peribacillus sp. AS_2]MDG4847009.1 spore germination protein [Peribacillus frigoritolerans]